MGYRKFPTFDTDELTDREYQLLEVMEEELRNNRWTRRSYNHIIKTCGGRKMFDRLYELWYYSFVEYDYEDDIEFFESDLTELYKDFVDTTVHETLPCHGFTDDELWWIGNVSYDEREWLDERFDCYCNETDWRYMFDWGAEYFDIIKHHYQLITKNTRNKRWQRKKSIGRMEIFLS